MAVTEVKNAPEEEHEERPEEEREERIPLALVFVEVARDLRLRFIEARAALLERLRERLMALNARLARERVVTKELDHVGRNIIEIQKVGPIGPAGEKKVVIQY